MTARRAAVGDRLLITCTPAPVSAVVTAEQVQRLGCGCDLIETTRPGGGRMDLVPASCHHAQHGIDFDAAREAAAARDAVTSAAPEPVLHVLDELLGRIEALPNPYAGVEAAWRGGWERCRRDVLSVVADALIARLDVAPAGDGA